MLQKQKSIISLSTIPNMILFVVLIVGLGAVIGLWAYEIFDTDKRLPLSDNRPDENNIIQQKDAIDNEYFGNKFIQVNSPQENSVIKNPILISGKANVFEGNVRVRIKDENENILADTFITASGAYDKLYPFEKEISYTAPTSQNGVMEVFEEDMKDGGDKNKVIIPVVFEDYVDIQDETADWKTYNNKNWTIKFPLTYERSGLAEEDVVDKFIEKSFQGINITDLPTETIEFSGFIFLDIQIKSANASLFEYVQTLAKTSKNYDEYFDQDVQLIKDPSFININGKSIIQTELFNFEGCPKYSYWFEKNPTKYIQIDVVKCFKIGGPFGVNGLTDNQRLAMEIEAQQILSTFKFTEN
jgi:hypothetical protein